MHSSIEFIEMKRANVRKYVFVRRVIEMRTSVNFSFAESFIYTKVASWVILKRPGRFSQSRFFTNLC